MTLLILNHLYAITLTLGVSLLAVLSYMLGVNTGRNLNRRPNRAGTTGRLIELGYIADIPVAYLVDPADAVEVARWLDAIKEGVGVRV